LIEETDSLGNLIKACVWLHGRPLARFDAGGAIYYYHNDRLGTPQRMTYSAGTVVWAADYLPFGQADVAVETVVNDLRFAGQYYDAETGLHYNYHRYYDSSLGRYLRADPIGLAGGINPYIYVANNPINAVDLFGLRDKYAGFGGPEGWRRFSAALSSTNKKHDPNRTSPGWGIKVKMPDFQAIFQENMKDVDNYLRSDYVQKQLNTFGSLADDTPSGESAIGLNYLELSMQLKGNPRVLIVRGLIAGGELYLLNEEKIHYLLKKVKLKDKTCDE
jgi:RHS repeat-associated protein